MTHLLFGLLIYNGVDNTKPRESGRGWRRLSTPAAQFYLLSRKHTTIEQFSFHYCRTHIHVFMIRIIGINRIFVCGLTLRR